MPTPDSIEAINNGGATVQVPVDVWVAPDGTRAVRTQNPADLASLLAQGYQLRKVEAGDLAKFADAFKRSGGWVDTSEPNGGSGGAAAGALAGAGAALGTPVSPISGVPANPYATPAPSTPSFTQAQTDAINARIGQLNADAQTSIGDLQNAYNLEQVGRERSALITRENYLHDLVPTQLGAAFSGAGYAQANGKIYDSLVNRDRSLASQRDQQQIADYQQRYGIRNVLRDLERSQQTAKDQMVASLQSQVNQDANAALKDTAALWQTALGLAK